VLTTRGLVAYQCGGQPNELYNGSFGAKTHIASAPTISPATNPLIMCPSPKEKPPPDMLEGKMPQVEHEAAHLCASAMLPKADVGESN